MGLCIDFYFADGRKDYVSMCYSSFSNTVMDPDDMLEWGFSDWEGQYMGEALNFLVERLVASGYLEKKFDPMPLIAVFC